MRMRHLIAAVCVLVCSCTQPDPFEAGLEAYKAKDYTTVLAKWKPLAEQGDADAQFNIGWMYDNGEGIPQDHKEAASWYRKAAEQGDAGAQNNLGVMYANGKGIPQDHKEAASWYRKAAEQGDARAQFNLGLMYDNGKGIPQDHKEAVNWYRKAAEQGHAGAQNNLGVMYRNGEGAAQDNVLAYMLYNLGAASGNEKSAKNRADIARQLSREQIEEGQALGSKWKPGTSLPTETKTGHIAKAGKKASKTNVTAAAPLKECSPPAGRPLRYSDYCVNGDCIRTFENGCQKRFQAAYCYDSLQGRWAWKPDGC